MELDADSVGKLVIAKTTEGVVHAVGTVIVYHPAPAVVIRKVNGDRVTWKADLCRLLTDDEKNIFESMLKTVNESE